MATRRLTDAQKLVVTVLNERGGEDHFGENDAALEPEGFLAAQEVAEAERRRCSGLLVAEGHTGIFAEHPDASLERPEKRPGANNPKDMLLGLKNPGETRASRRIRFGIGFCV